MDYYIDIKVRKNPEIAPQVILNTLFEKVHLILAEQKRSDVGISFPEFSEKGEHLGNILRLHGSLDALQDIGEHRFVRHMKDYADFGRVKKVPAVQKFFIVSRVQAKSSPERLRRRYMKRHGLTAEQAAEKIPDSAAEMLVLPFISLNSISTGQKFRLFVRHTETPEFSGGEFSTYGFSKTATVPKF